MNLKRRTARTPSKARAAWSLAYLEVAAKEAKGILDAGQYEHVVRQFDDLAKHENPRLSDTLDLKAIEAFHELRDKGGILGRINLRVFYVVFDEKKMICVLGCYKKEDDGQVPSYIKTRIRNRLRLARSMLGLEKG